MVENLVLVKEAAKSDDYVFTSDTRGEDTGESDLGNRRNLPPGTARGPDASRVRSYNRGSLEIESVLVNSNTLTYATYKTGYTPVHVRMAITRNGNCCWPGVSY